MPSIIAWYTIECKSKKERRLTPAVMGEGIGAAVSSISGEKGFLSHPSHKMKLPKTGYSMVIQYKGAKAEMHGHTVS
jgi:hypothetical protein